VPCLPLCCRFVVPFVLLVAAGYLLAHSAPLVPAAWSLSAGGASHAAGAAPASDTAPTVDAADLGGVHHYTIPGSLPGVPHAEDVPITGVLHVFLKALRWPDGHLRMKVGGEGVGWGLACGQRRYMATVVEW